MNYQIGDKVNYHSLIGGPITQRNATIRSEIWNCCGTMVCKITGKAGGVALSALTPAEDEDEVLECES